MKTAAPRQRTFHPQRFTLANGLRVLMVENPDLPAISLNLSILAGARHESDEEAGSAVMVGRLLDEGTETRSSLEIADAIESVGGAIECDGGYDRTSIYLTVLAKDIDLGLDLVADVVTRPVFLPESFEKERDRTLAEIRSAQDRPQVVAGWEFNELIYPGHPLHRPTHGYPDTIARLGRDDLQAFHRRFFLPNNAVLSVVGAISAPELLARLEAVFQDWKPGDLDVSDVPPPVRQQEIRRKLIPVPSKQAHVYFGHLGVERNHPDYYKLQVLDTILGGGAGLTARIPRKLRDEQGLAYTTFASITTSAGLDPGKFLAYIGTSPENVERAIAGFVEEIDRVVADPVTPDELDDARAYLTGSFVFAFESNAQIARFLMNAELFDLGFDYVQKYPAYVESIGAADVQAAAGRHLDTRNYSLVIAGPEAMLDAFR